MKEEKKMNKLKELQEECERARNVINSLQEENLTLKLNIINLTKLSKSLIKENAKKDRELRGKR